MSSRHYGSNFGAGNLQQFTPSNQEPRRHFRTTICDDCVCHLSRYLRERTLWYDNNDGPKNYVVYAGVPQDSVHGPLLRNIVYKYAPSLPVMEEAMVVSYPDNMALVAVTKRLEDAELY